MVYTIDEIKYIVIPIAKRYGIASISLFGSYAKGKATIDSDIDFIMDKGDLIGIKYFSLLSDLEDAFNCNVDLITTGYSNKEFLNNIKKDEVLLYER
ncbi:MAG: nucleotidyltransferase domain-containing protein [Methanobrevibacter sp.]|nr:nucleotidyltransferase domain-containing protein [Methanobrevibacter sp.]MBQ6345463.1 nucleotidyltransferase domain-containing protein [Methanobrevibacter sp.]